MVHTSFSEPFLGAGAHAAAAALSLPTTATTTIPTTSALRSKPCPAASTQGHPPPLLPVGWSEDSCELVSSLKILDCSLTQVAALRWPEKDFCNCKMYEMFYNYSKEHQEFSFERNYYIATILLMHDDFKL